MNSMTRLAWVAIAAISLSASFCHPLFGADKPNVLFIAIDDMNDWTGFLGGHPQAITPNLDQFAKKGMNFTNAHCIAPACSPCRLALLYGIEPFHSGLYPFYDHEKIPDSVLGSYTSLPALFRENGYQSFGAGKIFHGSKADPDSFDDYHRARNVPLKFNAADGYRQGKSTKMAFCPTRNAIGDHPDYQVADYGIDVLKKDHSEPFFLSVGIVKPHLPFVCPQEFFEMQADKITPPLIRHRDLSDVPWPGRSMAKLSDDFRFRGDDSWEDVQRAYLACITWADFNIGRVLDALAASPYADNTIVVIWSDHGYHLSEKRSFRKFTLWEESTRVPLIIHDPRIIDRSGPNDCDEAVSLINVYATVCDLAGVKVPSYVDGRSLKPRLEDAKRKLDSPAVTTWGRGNYSVRSDHWRYIRYFDGSEELYDHRSDPQEWKNLADDDSFASPKARLAEALPDKEAELVKPGIALWNVIDADRPKRLQSFKKKQWPQWKKKLKPGIE